MMNPRKIQSPNKYSPTTSYETSFSNNIHQNTIKTSQIKPDLTTDSQTNNRPTMLSTLNSIDCKILESNDSFVIQTLLFRSTFLDKETDP